MDWINKGEQLYHGSPMDMDFIALIERDDKVLYYGFNSLLSLAILTEKLTTGYGFIYIIEPEEQFAVPETAFAYVEPLFLYKPQKVGDMVQANDTWDTGKRAHDWDRSQLIFNPTTMEQEVEIPNRILPSINLTQKIRINVDSLRNIVAEYANNRTPEADMLKNIDKILALVSV